MHPVRRLFGRVATVVVVAAALVFGLPATLVWSRSSTRIFPVSAVPSRDVTLVFGAAMWGEAPSPYLQKRLDVAAALYKAGKTKVIIVSGTRDGGYSEPDGMKAALVGAGVPAARVVTDYDGTDTYSSCQRARDVFGVKSLIAVSQSYHLPRAVATCRLLGIDALGVGDDTVAHDLRWQQYRVRELGGDAKLIYDWATRRQVADLTPSDAVQRALDS